jgi:prenyltransferase, ubiA family
MSKIKEYMKLMRIKHYLKNVLIFLPLVFSGELLDIHNLTNCIVGFIIFSFTSSIVYIINDIKDIENDKKHPIKKKRPLPLGTVSKEEAIILALVLGVIAITLSIFVIGYERIIAIMLLLLYLAINVAYSFGLKKKPIVDIVILVAGFLIRVLYGAVITDIELSNWLYLTVISGAFYMGLGKRRNEILKQGDKSREVLKCYTKDFLDKNMYVCVALCIVFYSLWCVDPTTLLKTGNNLLIWTVPVIMIILMKYSLDIEGDSYGDPVDVIVNDKILLLIVLIYALFMFGIIYII